MTDANRTVGASTCGTVLSWVVVEAVQLHAKMAAARRTSGDLRYFPLCTYYLRTPQEKATLHDTILRIRVEAVFLSVVVP